jgi:uncharacterized protein with HEPN domain
MLDAAKAIQQYVANLTDQQFLADRTVRDAVNWNYCVIGEALSQLRQVDGATASQINEYTRIIGFRNQLIHGYGLVDDRVTWRITQDKLPILIRDLENLLKS